jgi:formylglycine-generating enzyme required for sulfatase activity
LKEASTVSAASILIENETDGSLLLLVPGGKFLAGTEKTSVELPPYYLAMHPVTNAQYARFLSQRRPEDHDLLKWILLHSNCFVRKSGNSYEAYGGKEDHPVVHVSWYGAAAYCQWAGVWLPTELGWEKAARGVDTREYPWGNVWDAGKCRNVTNKGSATTCGVWAYPEGCGCWGHYQMSGNVWEWCADVCEYRSEDGSRILCGGSWIYEPPGDFRCVYRCYYPPGGRYPDVGFRVAKTLAS